MFDFGWSELLLIGVLILFMFGPEEIPKIMYNLGKVVRRFRYMRYALSNQFEDFMQAAEKQAKKPANADMSVKPQQSEVVDDEGDADAQLLEMMPIPDKVLEKHITEADVAPIKDERHNNTAD